MTVIGKLLARALSAPLSVQEIERMRKEVAALIVNKPIFSNEWFVETGNDENTFYDESDTGAMHEHVAAERKAIMKKLFRWK